MNSFFFFFFPAELGDCDPLEHNLDLVSEFRFIPNQTEEVELAIYNAWKECRLLFQHMLWPNVLFLLLFLGLLFVHCTIFLFSAGVRHQLKLKLTT